MARKKIYRIAFTNQGKVYEIYARQIVSSDLYGFVEVAGIVFGERTTLVLDPAEEHLKLEFQGVDRTHIPFHSVIRIDEVEKEGPGKVIQISGSERQQLPPLQPPPGPSRGSEA